MRRVNGRAVVGFKNATIEALGAHRPASAVGAGRGPEQLRRDPVGPVMAAEIQPKVIRSSGDAMIGVVRDRRYSNKMRAIMTLTDLSQRRWQIELRPIELRAILVDALRLLTADETEVRRWWRQLTDSDDPPPGRPVADEMASAGVSAPGERAFRVSRPDPYIEVLFCFAGEDPADIRTHVVRALSPRSLTELAADVAAAEQDATRIEAAAAAWSVVYE